MIVKPCLARKVEVGGLGNTMFTIDKKAQRWNLECGIQKLAGAGLLAAVFFISGSAQTGEESTAVTADARRPQTSVVEPEPASMPLLKDYKGVTIGSTSEEVRDKLGKAKIDDDDGFYYRFDDSEIVQIRLDENKKVYLIAITYTADHKGAPSFADVLGSGPATTESKPDGSMYKLVRYPTAGYWVAYSRSAGTEGSVSVTMQKLH